MFIILNIVTVIYAIIIGVVLLKNKALSQQMVDFDEK